MMPGTRSTSVSDLKSHIGFWMRFVSNHVSQAFAAHLQRNEVTVAEWVVLREMYELGATSPSVVAERTGMTRGTASKLVDRLLAKKLLTRTVRADDRRFQDIELTPAARRLVPTLGAIADRNDRHFFAPLTLPERETLLALLQKLAQAHGLRKLPTE